MGLKKQYQIGRQQRLKRKTARKKLAAKGNNLTEYFYGRYYLKSASAGAGY
jgi:hypothetical protein